MGKAFGLALKEHWCCVANLEEVVPGAFSGQFNNPEAFAVEVCLGLDFELPTVADDRLCLTGACPATPHEDDSYREDKKREAGPNNDDRLFQG